MLEKIEITPLHRLVARKLDEVGKFYFKNDAIREAFSLDKEHEKPATDFMVLFNKELRSLQCELLLVGYEKRNETEYQFTYTVQSKKHNNAPLKIDRVFELKIPTLALPNRLAFDWIEAYKNIPKDLIEDVAKGN